MFISLTNGVTITSERERMIKMKTIAIIATGGTIAGTGKAGKTVSYHAGEMSVETILESIPMIEKAAHIKTYQLFNVDSNEMDEAHWLILKEKVQEVANNHQIDGIVVTHGTDTLDETAYFLNLTVDTNKPIVLTGAMRPATATSADGPFNLYQAVCLAKSEEAYGQGVMALFSNTIYSGRDIQKVNNYKIDAFDQKSFGCLGYMQDEKVYFFSQTFKLHTTQSMFSQRPLTSLPKVAVVSFYAGADASILDFLAQHHQGIVIVGSGSGNYSQAWVKAIRRLAKQGITFVRASRVSHGIIFDDAIFDPDQVCIPANTLSAQKARVLLMLALTQTQDIKVLKDIFEMY